MKKKIILTAIILMTIFVFSGCADIWIDAEITQDNLVTYSYILNFTGLDKDDPNYGQLELFLLDIQRYWEQNGIICSTDITDESIVLTGTMQRQCADREEAFNTLYEFMTNKITPFESVTLNYNSDFYSSSYILDAAIDLSGVLDQEVYEVHPQLVIDDITEFLQNSKCTAVFTLPYSETADSKEVIPKETIVNIPLDAPVKISISGSAASIENMQIEKNLMLKVKTQRALIIISAVSAVGAVAALIILIMNKKWKTNLGLAEESKDTEQQ
ncbi:MAG: hypothetical protein JXN65_10045 [Clostridia bacterium]|nr:hypothetical protein [Clostridia bacterium]